MIEAQTLTHEARFWAKVDVCGSDDCWEWLASRRRGYGQFWTGSRLSIAHRYSWEIHNGPIPDGLCVLHRCDNRGNYKVAASSDGVIQSAHEPLASADDAPEGSDEPPGSDDDPPLHREAGTA